MHGQQNFKYRLWALQRGNVKTWITNTWLSDETCGVMQMGSFNPQCNTVWSLCCINSKTLPVIRTCCKKLRTEYGSGVPCFWVRVRVYSFSENCFLISELAYGICLGAFAKFRKTYASFFMPVHLNRTRDFHEIRYFWIFRKIRLIEFIYFINSVKMWQ
jgi:hypothetical protein